MDDVPDYVISGLALAFLPVTLVAGLGLGAYQVGKVTSNEAKSWRKKSDTKAAEKALVKYIHTKTELIEANPKDAQAYIKRAMAFVLREDWAAAISDFWACIRLTPDDPRPYFDLALVYLVVNDRKAAERMYASSMEHLGPHHPKRMTMSGVDLPKKKPDPVISKKKDKSGKKEKISKKHDRPHFEFFELYQLRASNLYQIAIQPENTPHEQKDLLDKALEYITKAAEYYTSSKFGTYQKKGHLLSDMAIITYHQAFNPKTIRTYTHTIWKLVRLVLLGIQDPGSAFFMFKDLDFVWYFLIRDFDPVMKNCGYLDFPGFSTLDPYIFQQIERVYNYLQEIDTLGTTNELTEEYRCRCLYFLNRLNKEKNPEPLNPFKLPIIDRLHPECWDVKSYVGDFVGYIPCTFSTSKERWHYVTNHRPEWTGPIYDFKLSMDDGYSLSSNTLQFFNAGWDIKHGNFCLTCKDVSSPGGTYEYDFQRIEGDLYRGLITVVHENDEGVLPGCWCRCRAVIKPKELPLQAVHKWIVSLTRPRLTQPSSPRGGDPQEKLENALQSHTWSPIQLKRPKWCDQCKYHIKSWGLTTHLTCDVCHMLVHKTCASRVVCTCYQKPARLSLL